MDTSVKVVIIAAMEREIKPLVKGWRVTRDKVSKAGRTFAKGEAVVVCAGIGSNAARLATEVVIERYRPELVVSAGLAGALDQSLRAGETIIPEMVVNSSTGERHSTAQGSGVLVSTSGVAGAEAKRILARQYSAQLVDMEAAAVVEVAKSKGTPFAVVKAISDEVDFDVPDFEPFVDADGRFLTSKFAIYLMMRPGLWSVARMLSVNAAYASRELCVALRKLIDEHGHREDLGALRPVGSGRRNAL